MSGFRPCICCSLAVLSTSRATISLFPFLSFAMYLQTISGVNIESNFGSVLLGSLAAICLSGVLGNQCAQYFRVFTADKLSLKIMVASIWILDVLHSICIVMGLWNYCITGYGNPQVIQIIGWKIAWTVSFTAMSTFVVQCFFARRIGQLSGSLLLSVPIALIALVRMVAAYCSMGLMIKLKTYYKFKAQYEWVFTLGLATSAAADMLITASMYFLLRRNRQGIKRTDHILDTLIRHTLENGSLTSAGAVISLIFWVKEDNLVFLGIHFVISKLYSNSLLATLHARTGLRDPNRSKGTHQDVPILPLFPSSRRGNSDAEATPTTNDGFLVTPRDSNGAGWQSASKTNELKISVQHTVQTFIED